MFAEFFSKDEFYKKYIQLFSVRLAFGNLEMESEKEDYSIPSKSIELYNNMNALMWLIEENQDKLSPYDIADIAYLVNKDLNFFDKGFRKTQVDVRKAKNFFPRPANEVVPAMYALYNAYYNIWDILPIYEREAKYHIELVRLQPFEDGNKRTARIVTCYNLCKQNKAPIIVSRAENDEYFGYIDNYDVEGFAKFIEKKSKEELEVMLSLYQSMNDGDFSFENSTSLSDDNVHIYSMARDKKK